MSETTTTVERCTVSDIGLEVTGQDAAIVIQALDEYLAAFAKPVRSATGGEIIGRHDCLNCSGRLDGFIGTFQWGIVHGEGKCIKCGWPARAYHRPKLDGEEIFDGPLQRILQYHPDFIKETKND